MPIYEYRCMDCGHAFESLQKMSDDPISTCPSCEGGAVKKQISQTAFVLKGGGWYKDHYGLKKNDGGTSKPSSSDAPKKTKEKSTPSKPTTASSDS